MARTEHDDSSERGETPTPPEPRYGMRLPEGARIEDYIVPRDPRGARELSQSPDPFQSTDHYRGSEPSGAGARASAPARAGGAPTSHPAPASHPAPSSQSSASPGPFPGVPARPAQDPFAGPADPWGNTPGQYGGPYPPHGAYPPHPPSPEERHRSARRRRAVIVTVLGALAMVLFPLGGILAGTVSALGDNLGAVASALPVNNGGAVSLPADAERSVSSSGGGVLQECTITDPSGAGVPVEAVDGQITRENTMAIPGARFRTTDAGQYTIACADAADGAQLLVGPPMVVRDVGATQAWMLGGMFLGSLGLVATVWGAATLVRTRRR